MVVKGGDDCVNDVAMGSYAAANVNFRLGIHGPAFLGETRESFRTITMTKERAVVSAARPFGQDVNGRVEPDRYCTLVEQLARTGIDESAASGRDDPHGTVDESRYQPALAVAEIAFAELLEKLRSTNSRGLLDLVIAVNEWQAEPLGQPSANRGLACAHESDKHDRSIKRGGQLFHEAGLYIEAQGRAKAFRPTESPSGVTMPRGLIFLVLIVLLLIGGIYFLSRSASEVPVQPIEADVTANAATN